MVQRITFSSGWIARCGFIIQNGERCPSEKHNGSKEEPLCDHHGRVTAAGGDIYRHLAKKTGPVMIEEGE